MTGTASDEERAAVAAAPLAFRPLGWPQLETLAVACRSNRAQVCINLGRHEQAVDECDAGLAIHSCGCHPPLHYKVRYGLRTALHCTALHCTALHLVDVDVVPAAKHNFKTACDTIELVGLFCTLFSLHHTTVINAKGESVGYLRRCRGCSRDCAACAAPWLRPERRMGTERARWRVCSPTCKACTGTLRRNLLLFFFLGG